MWFCDMKDGSYRYLLHGIYRKYEHACDCADRLRRLFAVTRRDNVNIIVVRRLSECLKDKINLECISDFIFDNAK